MELQEPDVQPEIQEGVEPAGPDVWASTAPWGMQLVLRDDRPVRPAHLPVCEAAAAAVVVLLTDVRAMEGDWAERVRHWASGPIRKVVRRGRGVRWTATAALPHVEVERRGACVRAFLPGPVDLVPPELARLQVGGTQVPELGDPAPAGPGTLTIALTPHAELSTGKAAAQAGHAAQLALATMPPPIAAEWLEAGLPIRVTLPGPGAWEADADTWPVAVHDGGFTEVEPGTLTALARWP